MKSSKKVIFGSILFAAVSLLLGAGQCFAQAKGADQPRATKQIKPGRDIEAVQEYRKRYVITQAQRQAAADRAKAANPGLAKRIAENRAAMKRVSEARIKKLKKKTAIEATKKANIVDTKTQGGANE